MASAIQPHRGKLPVVTQEIGDTWIYGVASDPLKVARYRELSRLREGWIADGAFKVGDATDVALLRHLLLAPEHTWGTDTKTWLDFDNYKPADLAKILDTKNYKVVAFSWQEKRQDIADGVAALPAKLRDQAQAVIDSMNPGEPRISGKSQVHFAGRPIETAHFTIDIDPRTGAIVGLRNKATGREWASRKNPVALFTYQTLSADDYDRFLSAYLTTKADWAKKDFGKPNIEKLGAKSQDLASGFSHCPCTGTADVHRVVVTMRFKDAEATQSGRAAFPRIAFLDIRLPKAEPVIYLGASWFGKPATRLPEALWLTFNPIAADQNGWSLDKSNEQSHHLR